MLIKKLKSFFQSSWFYAGLILIFYFLSTGYKYGWDDQHLEIPLLKHLIDPSLYEGDYYVESLQKNFSSFFYPFLAKFITVEQIPPTYFAFFIISRYFLFFWMFKIWKLISRSSFTALACMATFITIARIPEFLYRTFSHQEFGLAFIFAGIFLFFRGYTLAAAIVLGLSANIHALYALFPMVCICGYLVWEIKKEGWRELLICGSAFAISCSPFIIWTIKNKLLIEPQAISPKDTDWVSLYMLACPQNFMFGKVAFAKLTANFSHFFSYTKDYLVPLYLFILNIIFNKTFRTNKKAVAYCVTAFGMLVVCLFFTYIFQNKFINDLNLTRNGQFLSFFLMGFTTIMIVDTTKRSPQIFGLSLILALICLKLDNSIVVYGLLLLPLILSIHSSRSVQRKELRWGIYVLLSIGAGVCFWQIAVLFKNAAYLPSLKKSYLVILAVLLINLIVSFFIKNPKISEVQKKAIIIIPLSILLLQFHTYKKIRIKKELSGTGFWQLQRNWEDMQRHVQKTTPKDAMLLVPYNMEMGGFRILSERKIIASYRDCGIVGFDYSAAHEWKKRIDDIKPFKFLTKEPIGDTIKIAIMKYKVNYIVFMNYAAPKSDNSILSKVYANDIYSLFRINLFQ